MYNLFQWQGRLFGSRARGNASWDSDFDICIVLSQIDPNVDRWIRNIAWEIGFENDRIITTVLISKEQFEHGPMSESTLVENTLYEGIQRMITENIRALVTYRLEQAAE